MAYPKHSPVSEKYMHKERWEGHNSICQYLRDIYNMTNNAEIKMKCRVGVAMTKAMHEKLKEYKKNADKNNMRSE